MESLNYKHNTLEADDITNVKITTIQNVELCTKNINIHNLT
jgi:hypothetical protein